MFEQREPEPVRCPCCNGKDRECEECEGSGEVSPFYAVSIRANRIALMADERYTDSKTK